MWMVDIMNYVAHIKSWRFQEPKIGPDKLVDIDIIIEIHNCIILCIIILQSVSDVKNSKCLHFLCTSMY